MCPQFQFTNTWCCIQSFCNMMSSKRRDVQWALQFPRQMKCSSWLIMFCTFILRLKKSGWWYFDSICLWSLVVVFLRWNFKCKLFSTCNSAVMLVRCFVTLCYQSLKQLKTHCRIHTVKWIWLFFSLLFKCAAVPFNSLPDWNVTTESPLYVCATL